MTYADLVVFPARTEIFCSRSVAPFCCSRFCAARRAGDFALACRRRAGFRRVARRRFRIRARARAQRIFVGFAAVVVDENRRLAGVRARARIRARLSRGAGRAARRVRRARRFAALGICALVSAAHLLSLYLGLELMSLSLYAMIALRRDHPPAIEAALKYFVLGALASGLFLYGASMIYGATGELGFARIAAAAASGDRALLSLGLAFALCGAAFKLGAAPFHMWLPDVYDGAPAATTAFIAAAPKIAAFAFLLRVIVEALGDLISDWRPMLIFLAVASLAVGNLAAIAQTNIKRMLAYSSISHAGFIVLGVVGAGVDGVAASLFYVIAYALMSAGGFGAVALLSQNGREADNLSDLAGLSSRAGLPAAVIWR